MSNQLKIILQEITEALEALTIHVGHLVDYSKIENMEIPLPKSEQITLEQVRALLAAKKWEGKSITELLSKYGASKLTDIDPKSFPDILKDAGEL